MSDRLTNHQVSEIRDMLRSEGELNAIRLYREFTGSSQVAAQEYVEALNVGIDRSHKGGSSHLDDAVMDVILDHLESGRKLNAVKVYKEASGLSLIESKQFIEKLMDQLGIDPPQPVRRSKPSKPEDSGLSRAITIFIAIVIATRLIRLFF